MWVSCKREFFIQQYHFFLHSNEVQAIHLIDLKYFSVEASASDRDGLREFLGYGQYLCPCVSPSV